MKTKEFIKEKCPFISRGKTNLVVSRWAKDQLKYHKKYNLTNCSKKEAIEYRIMLLGHAIEKGMTSPEPRPFGTKKVQEIINYIKTFDEEKWDKAFAYDFGIGILIAYKKFYEQYGWADRKEYTLVNDSIKEKK